MTSRNFFSDPFLEDDRLACWSKSTTHYAIYNVIDKSLTIQQSNFWLGLSRSWFLLSAGGRVMWYDLEENRLITNELLSSVFHRRMFGSFIGSLHLLDCISVKSHNAKKVK